MEKMKIFVGVSALCLLFSFNLRHALNDYGVSNPNNKLHPQILAQTNTAGNPCGGWSGSMPICNCGSFFGTNPPGSGTPGDGGDDRSRCYVEWVARVNGIEVVLRCSADCAPGQQASCRQNNCRCT